MFMPCCISRCVPCCTLHSTSLLCATLFVPCHVLYSIVCCFLCHTMRYVVCSSLCSVLSLRLCCVVCCMFYAMCSRLCSMPCFFYAIPCVHYIFYAVSYAQMYAVLTAESLMVSRSSVAPQTDSI